jgi:hypothetical protein
MTFTMPRLAAVPLRERARLPDGLLAAAFGLSACLAWIADRFAVGNSAQAPQSEHPSLEPRAALW